MTTLETVARETMWMSASNSWVSINKVTWMQRNNPKVQGICCRIGSRNRRCGSAHTSSLGLVMVKACGSVHGSGLSFP